MKLKNKLLPIMGIAVPAAIITPFITSCGCSNGEYHGSWSWDPATGYTPLCAARDAETFKVDPSSEPDAIQLNNKIINLWVEDIKNNYNVFYDEFAYFKLNPYTMPTYEIFDGFIPTKISMQLTDVSTQKASYTQLSSDEKADHALISLKAHFEGYAEYINESGEIYQTYTNMDTEIKNIPYVMFQSSITERYVMFLLNKSAIAELNNLTAHITIEQNNIKNDITIDENHEPDIDFPILAPGTNPESSKSIPSSTFLGNVFGTKNPYTGQPNPSYHFLFSFIDFD